MRTVGVVTSSRADYDIYVPVLHRITEAPDLDLAVYVTGMHLSARFGMTVERIERDGFPVVCRVDSLSSGDAPEDIASAMGKGTQGFARALSERPPDILLVLGDRFEMHAAVVAAVPFKIPVAHIHGGEVTAGAIDDCLRHSITKMSHLHFASTEEHARRIRQLGEESWRVQVTGAPGLDNLAVLSLLSADELGTDLGVALDPAPVLVTFHSVTLDHERTDWQVDELLAALENVGRPIIFTMPNADTAGQRIAARIQNYVAAASGRHICDNLGAHRYFSLMRHAAVMVGNSSSGIIEAPSLGLPVVNIGDRQEGRQRAVNVRDVGYDRDSVSDGIAWALSEECSMVMEGLENPYGDGKASGRIVSRLQNVELGPSLIKKRFVDVPLVEDLKGGVV